MSVIGDSAEPALSWHPGGRKFRLLAAILLVLSALYAIGYLWTSVAKGWPVGFGDSFALWSWGRFLAEYPAGSIYDPAVLRPAMLALGMDAGQSYPFGYPPSYLPVLWGLGQLSGPVALVVLMTVSLPLYLWGTLGRKWRSPGLVAALAAPTTAIVIVSGQSSFLAAGLLTGGLRLVASNPIAGGVLLGLLSYKPQLGLLVPVALVAAGLWRAVAAAAVTGIVLVVGTSMVFGPAIWLSWAAALPVFSRQFAAENGQILHLMPTILAALLQLGVAPAYAQLVQWIVTGAAALTVWGLFRCGADRSAGAGLLVAALLATPYGFVYDMPILATAVIWIVAERHRTGGALGTGELLVLVLAMLAPMTLAAGTSRFPLAAISLIALLGVIAWHSLRLPILGGSRTAPAGSSHA